MSVVIPTWNECRRIEGAIRQFEGQAGSWERIVVDGGSDDGTPELARRAGAEVVLQAPRGRGPQMNAGARVARGSILLFLHADVRLPPGAHALIVGTMSREDAPAAGCFRTWTVPERKVRPAFRWLLHLADLRSRYTSLPYGDQAVFLRAETFRAVSGFPSIPLMEDLEFSRRLRARGPVRTLPARVQVSGRRFESAPVWQTLLVNVFPLAYRLGVPAAWLARLYGAPR